MSDETDAKADGVTGSEATGCSSEPRSDGGIVVDSHETGGEHGHGEVHDDHASFWPFLLSLAAFLTIMGISGIRLGEDAIKTEGMIFPILAIVGGAFLLFTLAGFTYESFVASPQRLATRWPFDGVEKMKLGLWIFLGSDIVLFGAFIGSYIFIRVAEGWTTWHHLIPEAHVVLPGLINTYLLLASSFAVVLAMDAAQKQNRWGVTASLVTTFVLATGFLINKGIEWEHLMTLSSEHFPKGWEFGTNVASSTFYVTTGLHGLHVTIGLLMLMWMIPRAWNGAYSDNEHGDKPIEYFGLYWHFVDIVWLFLFPLFYIL